VAKIKLADSAAKEVLDLNQEKGVAISMELFDITSSMGLEGLIKAT